MNIYSQPVYYVYAYLRNNDLPYYIGKGKNDRAWKKHKNVKTPKNINKIIILESNLTEIGALAIERRMIKWYGRKIDNSGILLNKTEGGDGICGARPFRTEEHRKNLSLSQKGKPRPKSSVEKRKITMKNKGPYNLTEEHKNKISKSLKGKKKPEYHKGRTKSITIDGIFFQSLKQAKETLKINNRKLYNYVRTGSF
jgi:hypothetical protein